MTDSVLWYAARGAGAVSLLLLTGVVTLGVLAALRWRASAWPRFLTVAFHRNLALLSVTFLGLHIVTAVVDPYTSLGWSAALIPFSSFYRTFWLGLGAIAVDLLLAALLTSLIRRVIGHRTWRLIHWVAYACWPLAFAHGLGTGSDSFSPWLLTVELACLGAVLLAVALRLFLQPAPPAPATADVSIPDWADLADASAAGSNQRR
ncbi:MAG: ferric reductase-like transmembrane domain-containing protein [Candidatus Dormibacteraeota bacterium]|nr:ferric reductase-like transmembrane domain-containing protein [Candidatus Dormibacteraeota bacterium]